MNTSAADLIAAARMTVHARHPYLSHALFALRPYPAPGLGTVAVDAGWRLYYDPKTIVEWYNTFGHDSVAAAVFHELGHVLREHFSRLGDRDPVRANLSQDREINDDVVEAGWKLPGQPLLPAGIGMVNGLLWEEYYRQEQEPVTITLNFPGCGCPCGGVAGNPTQWEKENTGNEHGAGGNGPAPGFAPGEESSDSSPFPHAADGNEQQIVLRRTALDVAKHIKAHGKGSVPAGLRAWAETKLTPPKIDWRRKLAGMTRQALAATAGACDFTWRKLGRRSLHSAGRAGWPLAPALHQPVPRVAIVLDTSGSMGCGAGDERTVMDLALSEVVGIALAAGGGVTAYACDAAVHAKVKVGSVRDLERLNKGGGGTDMRPGFLAARKDRPDIVVIVTDGYVGDDWPVDADCRGIRLLAVLVGKNPGQPPAHIPFVEAIP